MVRLPVQRNGLRRTGPLCNYGVTGSGWSRRSPRDHHCCRASPSHRRRWPLPNLVGPEQGAASLVAVAMMAVLLAITIGGVYVGSAVIARHRAQAAADLAALSAAVHVGDGTSSACGQAAALASAMRTAMHQCVVEDLDVLVTVEARLPLERIGAGPARAAARAGPVG
jgi:secretion/DNA translocation related TadE-like protein